MSEAEIKIEIEKMKLYQFEKDLASIKNMLANNFLKSYQTRTLLAKKLELEEFIINLLNKRDLIFYLSLFRVFVYNENNNGTVVFNN